MPKKYDTEEERLEAHRAAHKAANDRARANLAGRYTLDFPRGTEALLNHLNGQANKAQYLRALIAADMDTDGFTNGQELIDHLSQAESIALDEHASRLKSAKRFQQTGYTQSTIDDALWSAYQAGRAKAFEDVLQHECGQPGKFTHTAEFTMMGQIMGVLLAMMNERN